jgi:putative membrane protein
MKKLSFKAFSAIAASCLAASGIILAASGADSRFAKAAAQGGITEVTLGKLASEKASDPAVKAFGQQMVDDHGAANEKLKAIGQQESMDLPGDMDIQQKAMYAKLKGLSGSAFDKAYVSGMVKDHEGDVRDFSREASAGSDPKIKQFAADTLPVIKGHLDKIKGIQSRMTSSGGM